MFIFQNKGIKKGSVYCFAYESVWNSELKKYETPNVAVGSLKGDPPLFMPNKFLSSKIRAQMIDEELLSEHDKLVIKTTIEKYGKDILNRLKEEKEQVGIKTAEPVFVGPSLIFDVITSRYNLHKMLTSAFDKINTDKILSLVMYVICEGSVLSNSDSWLDYFENLNNGSISSQDISRLLDDIKLDGIMTFYKQCLNSCKTKRGKILYDLASISTYGTNIDEANWGYNRDKEDFQQVNYGLLCYRDTGMPIFSWVMNGSINDVATLKTTYEYLNKLGYKPDCLMLDRAFGTIDNITHLLKNNYTFFQTVENTSEWVMNLIDSGSGERFEPISMLEIGNQTYFATSTPCFWIFQSATQNNGKVIREHKVIPKNEYSKIKNELNIIEKYSCMVHILFTEDLVKHNWPKLSKKVSAEYDRLVDDEDALPIKEFEEFFIITKQRKNKKRVISFNQDRIKKERFNYSGNVCFITNDKSIDAAKVALSEYSTRDHIEKDFDEIKNELDMRILNVQNSNRMNARLFIQFIAEIYMREIR
ncbi:MAG: hypothetical protein LBF12_06385, partial [Christensenellaceae bacterium]|nr:hypothetical protein [Christensenellaceae bacterium]